ncbi:hypothetical protein BLA39750_01046 [Burkholderia lata]|uniref:Uncharacterized protein n=1 Tax=Burkholderia lata (strain ATCC 17760 / DSM 23089 / LMG 22485 / NCIMB 9086 / R18194 / 383) TaxID=482957 RepID=A0A6P2V5U4_BURL3|nr:hypothetical protein [Burkholderia lata]VWC78822.1 hypothetical protein BLA39750_01046 [Burkholderia lata]
MNERTKVAGVLICLWCGLGGMSFARVVMPPGGASDLIWFGSGIASVVAAFYYLMKR